MKKNVLFEAFITFLFLIGCYLITGCSNRQSNTVDKIEFVKGVEEDREKAPSAYDERYGTPVVGQEAVTDGLLGESENEASQGTDDVVGFSPDEGTGDIDDPGIYSGDYY